MIVKAVKGYGSVMVEGLVLGAICRCGHEWKNPLLEQEEVTV